MYNYIHVIFNLFSITLITSHHHILWSRAPEQLSERKVVTMLCPLCSLSQVRILKTNLVSERSEMQIINRDLGLINRKKY